MVSVVVQTLGNALRTRQVGNEVVDLVGVHQALLLSVLQNASTLLRKSFGERIYRGIADRRRQVSRRKSGLFPLWVRHRVNGL